MNVLIKGDTHLKNGDLWVLLHNSISPGQPTTWVMLACLAADEATRWSRSITCSPSPTLLLHIVFLIFFVHFCTLYRDVESVHGVTRQIAGHLRAFEARQWHRLSVTNGGLNHSSLYNSLTPRDLSKQRWRQIFLFFLLLLSPSISHSRSLSHCNSPFSLFISLPPSFSFPLPLFSLSACIIHFKG